MTELIINEFLNTFPYHVLGYVPFLGRLRFPVWKITMLVVIGESLYLGLFAALVNHGCNTVFVQYLALPVFLILMCIVIDTDIGIIAFEFTFIIDYLLVIRAASFSICRSFGLGFMSLKSGLITLLLIMSTVIIVARLFTNIIAELSSVHIPAFWKTAWILPCISTIMVLLLTGDIRSGNYNNTVLAARVLLLVCMFLISRLMIQFVKKMQEEADADAKARAMENLLKVQGEQYAMLQKRMDENRRARHDFRQHRRVIQDLVAKDDIAALKRYLSKYSEQFDPYHEKVYCRNHAVNAILSFYADKAERRGIVMTVSVKMAEKTIIPETELCVLIGNLLENAIDACEADITNKGREKQAFIKVIIMQTGGSMLSIAVDNSSIEKPVYGDSGSDFMSAKHSGKGIGTESVSFIAARYSGDARFEWRDGVFYASVMLNPQ